MAIAGTWRRECSIHDVSDDGAKLAVGSSIEGLQLTVFFLVLSSTGLADRHCKLAWVNGEQIGVIFPKRSKTAVRREPRADLWPEHGQGAPSISLAIANTKAFESLLCRSCKALHSAVAHGVATFRHCSCFLIETRAGTPGDPILHPFCMN